MNKIYNIYCEYTYETIATFSSSEKAEQNMKTL